MKQNTKILVAIGGLVIAVLAFRFYSKSKNSRNMQFQQRGGGGGIV